MGWVDVCGEADVPERRGWPVAVGERRIAVFRDGGAWRAVDNACLHAGAPLDDALVEHGCIRCPFHGWRYSLATGELHSTLGHRPGLVTYPVRVEGRRVLVDLPDEPGGTVRC